MVFILLLVVMISGAVVDPFVTVDVVIVVSKSIDVVDDATGAVVTGAVVFSCTGIDVVLIVVLAVVAIDAVVVTGALVVFITSVSSFVVCSSDAPVLVSVPVVTTEALVDIEAVDNIAELTIADVVDVGGDDD